MRRAARASRAVWAQSQFASGARCIGDKGVPPEYGQPSEGGTGFLGTPENHSDLLKQRPLSPDVFGLEGGSHYKFPIVAISSITNRVTGSVLSSGFATAGAVALVGDLPSSVETLKSAGPLLTTSFKFAVAFPFVYHTLGGFRHIVWDETHRGISLQGGRVSSFALYGSSIALTACLALWQSPL